MRRDGLFPNNASSEAKHQVSSQVKLPALGPLHSPASSLSFNLALQVRPASASLLINPEPCHSTSFYFSHIAADTLPADFGKRNSGHQLSRLNSQQNLTSVPPEQELPISPTSRPRQLRFYPSLLCIQLVWMPYPSEIMCFFPRVPSLSHSA